MNEKTFPSLNVLRASRAKCEARVERLEQALERQKRRLERIDSHLAERTSERDRTATREGLNALIERCGPTTAGAFPLRKRQFLMQLMACGVPLTFEQCRRLLRNAENNPLSAYRTSAYLNELIKSGFVRVMLTAEGEAYEVAL